MKRRRAVYVALVGWLMCPQQMTPDPITNFVTTLWGQSHSVWDGVYTDQQATRGRSEYLQACASCHAEDLRGRSTAPSLVEDDFAFQWEDKSVGDLFTKTRAFMPSDRPGSLSDQTYVDIIAFILQKNAFPAGGKELPLELEALSQIRVRAKRP